jgi:predicted amidophosphoribosyltransferase
MAWCRSGTRFEGAASSLVRALKYEGWLRVAPVLVRPMLRALEDGVLSPSAGDAPPLGGIVPVPTTPKRLRERGFNPARVLAEGVGQALDLPVLEALSRPLEAPRQVGLPPSRRAANVKGAFVAERGPRDSLLPPYVLLVDDVLTTGATGVAAAESLARAGVARVGFLTFARALPGDPGS